MLKLFRSRHLTRKQSAIVELMENRRLLTAVPALVSDTLSTTGVTIVGNWATSASGSGRYGATFLTDSNTNKGQDSVIFSETVPSTALYQVDVRYSSIGQAANVPITVSYQGGNVTIPLNESANSGMWFPLGVYSFSSASTGSITFSNAGTTGTVICDAVRLVLASEVASPPTVAPSATSTAPGQVVMNWANTSATANGEFVQRSVDGIHFTQIASLGSTATTYTDSTTYGSTNYTYQIVPYVSDPSGNILSYSPAATVLTQSHVPVTLYVSPTGLGIGTSPASPAGSIADAFAIAQNGDTIQMANGTYAANQSIPDKAEDAQFTQNVIVAPAPGATVILAGTVTDYAQHMTFQNLVTQGLINMEFSASYSGVANLVDSGGVFAWGDYQSVMGCQFSVYDQDAVDICAGANNAQNHDVLIENNIVYFTLYKNLTSAQIHLDAFQLWDTYNDTIINNIVHQTENSCVIISTGRQGTVDVDNILVENNFFDNDLAPATNLGLWDIDARNGTHVIVVNNTLIGGITIVNPNVGNVLVNNIIGNLAAVGEPETYNYITGYNAGIHVVPSSTDVIGTSPMFANAGSVDYHLVLSGGQAENVTGTPINLQFGSTAYSPATDIDAEPRNPGVVWVGADVPTVGQVNLLSSRSFYLKLDSDGQHVDIWNTPTAAGQYAQQLMLSQVSQLTLNINTGTGSLVLDNSAGEVYPASGITFAGDGSNAIKVVGSPGMHSVTSTVAQFIYDGNSANYLGASQVVFDPDGGDDALGVTSGQLVLAAPSGGAGVSVRQFSNINIGAGATLQAANAASQSDRAFLVVSSLTIAGTTNSWTGTFDLNDNDLDVIAGNLSVLTNQIAEGYSIGTWAGQGIISSSAATDPTRLTTLGIALNNDGNGNPLFGSNTALGLFDNFNPSATDVLIKYTYYGDANLDGKVDGSDYSRVDSGFNVGSSGWSNGDFNYDGVNNGSDYTLIDNAFNTQGASLSAIAAVANSASIKTNTDANVPPIRLTTEPKPGVTGGGSKMHSESTANYFSIQPARTAVFSSIASDALWDLDSITNDALHDRSKRDSSDLA